MENKLYIVSNFGRYVDRVDTKNKTCGWSHGSPICDSLSLTYQRAYNIARKVNRLYGADFCWVERLNAEDYNPYWWGVFCKHAENNHSF